MPQVTIDLETADIAAGALIDSLDDYTTYRDDWEVGHPYWTRLNQERDRIIQHLTALNDAIENATTD